MSDKVQKSVRVPPDVAEYIEKKADKKGVSEADLMRALLRDGVRFRQHLQRVPQHIESIDQRLKSIDENQESSGSLFGD